MRKIGKNNLIADGKLLHMRYCAHILNLIVNDGLDKLKYAIENIRDSVAYWIATLKRVEKFEEIAKHCKVKIGQKKYNLIARLDRIQHSKCLALYCHTRLSSLELVVWIDNILVYQVKKNESLLLMLWRGLVCSMTSLNYFLGLIM
jgi:hypothetical protein